MAYVNPNRHPYYNFSAIQSSTRHRMVVSLHDPYEWFDYESQLFHGNWGPPPVLPILAVVLKLRKNPEDMPWCGEGKIVSTRMKNLLLRFEPNMLDFYDVSLTMGGEPWTEVQYHHLNTRRVVECHDPEGSVYKPTMWGGMEMSPFFFDMQPLPQGVHLSRVMHFESTWVVSDTVRQAMEAEGMTGCCFFDPNPPVPLW